VSPLAYGFPQVEHLPSYLDSINIFLLTAMRPQSIDAERSVWKICAAFAACDYVFFYLFGFI
jgi:hypothetical protein